MYKTINFRAVGKDIYWDTPSGQYSKCSHLCGSYPKACAEYCPDYIQAQSTESSGVLSAVTHASWPLILSTGIGVLTFILIVAVVYVKRICLMTYLKKMCGPDLKYPDLETGFIDPLLPLHDHNNTDELPNNNNTGDQSLNAVDTNASSSEDHDIDDEDACNYAATMPAIQIEPTALPEEAIEDVNSAEEDESGENIAARGSNAETLPSPSQKLINFQHIRVGNTIPEHDPPQQIINTVGNDKQPMDYRSNESLINALSDTSGIANNSNTNTAEHDTELSSSVVFSETTPEPANWTQALSDGKRESGNTQETLVIPTRELENVLSQQPTEESGIENHASNNPSCDPRALRRIVGDTEQGIHDAETAGARADSEIDMTRSDRSLAVTGLVEKQVMRPRYDREDSRQEVQ
ncbi:uncharacterized protein LOC127857572 isoform X4 [Dreissena polymorpha]|uniref:uncharacterized protein LOC127857572 isoform X4 n=1 Tax=Dreissena polymorpha TaxID=45954 RepID=UPI0022653651|nr:uncharacterized protein LOC127857572 isoform X4 [Dreissena polymorpha]